MMVIEQVNFPNFNFSTPSAPGVTMTSDFNEENLVKWIAVIVGVVVLIVLIRYFQVRMKKRRRERH
jgi:hypothetical protein